MKEGKLLLNACIPCIYKWIPNNNKQTLPKGLHIHFRTLKPYEIIPSLRQPEPTPWTWSTLENHCRSPSEPLSYLTRRKRLTQELKF